MSGSLLFRSRALLAAVVVVGVVGIVAPASAQTPNIVSAPPFVAAGPDFATDWLANPWDFSDALDLSPFPDELAGWTISSTAARTVGRTAFLSGGRFIGRTTTGGHDLVPLLYRGGAGVTSWTESSGVFDHKAIPTSRYGRLSVAVTLSATTAGQLVAFWYSGPYGAEQGRGAAFNYPRAGTHIYTVDLLTGMWYDLRGNAVGPNFVPAGVFQQIAWNGAPLMRGFQFRPTSDGNASVDVQVDWVRITTRDDQAGAALLPITFSGCPGRPYNVEVDIGGGFDIIHAGIASPQSTTTANVNYGVLPPGEWPFRVACYSSTREGISPPIASQPVRITINHPPVPFVLNPDAAGGGDFATEVLGDPWDWNALSDARLLGGMTNPAIVSDGVTNALQGTGTATGDPSVFLLYGNGQIDTRRYRMLTFAETLDTPFGLNGALREGSVGRVFWGSGETTAVSTTRDILIWPGRNVYTIDLAALSAANGGLDSSCGGCPPWQATPIVRGFRIDPHEATAGPTFRLGHVTLAAFDEVGLGTAFPISYGFSDPDPGSFQARIYLDTDLDRTAMTHFDTIRDVVPYATLTYSFNPGASGVPPGLYFIYVEIVETRSGVTEVNGAYSSGPIVVSSTAGPLPPGAPTLTTVQTSFNPITLSWSAGAGGAPTNYTICGGTTPGGTQFGCFNMGLVTQISANVPAGLVIYGRVIASNAVGSAVSNEIAFVIGGEAPGPPTMNAPIISGQTVTLSWNRPASGGAPSSYVLVARVVGNPNPMVMFPLAANSITVPGVPPGDYLVTVAAVNGAGVGAESNGVIVSVR